MAVQGGRVYDKLQESGKSRTRDCSQARAVTTHESSPADDQMEIAQPAESARVSFNFPTPTSSRSPSCATPNQ